ncbi:MAG: hypothetical protein ACMUIE_05990 [Thermoplasmatota archaeon]
MTEEEEKGRNAPVEEEKGGEEALVETKEEVFDDDENELFQRLLKKLEDADEMDKELDSDLGDFTERVTQVVDSIERIENLEKSAMEEMVYKKPPEEEVKNEGSEPEPQESVEISAEMEYIPPPGKEGGMMYAPSESPYADIKESLEKLKEVPDLSGEYGRNVDMVLEKLMMLIRIKIKKEELTIAKQLFGMAVSIGASSDFFRSNFISLADELGIDIPKEELLKVAGSEKVIPGIFEDEEETTVLDPELADEISILQKRASSAIHQLDQLISSSKLSQEDFNQIKKEYLEAAQSYREKMFHKAYNIALKALEKIKTQVQDTIDNQIQDTLYKAKEMYENFAREMSTKKPEMVDEMKLTFDRAMKAYLTNEYERANLLAKRVINSILDESGHEGGPLREKAEEFKKDIRKLKDLNIHLDDVQEIENTLKKAEDLLDRRDFQNTEKLMSRIKKSIEELRKKGEVYANAKEIEIRLSNRIERLKGADYDLASVSKKLDYIHSYLADGRYDDVMELGGQIEDDIKTLELTKKENESKAITDELSVLMENVDKLDDPIHYRSEFAKIKAALQNKDHDTVIDMGRSLLEEIQRKKRTLTVDQGKKLAGSIIESKLLIHQLRTLNVDTTSYERKVRKAKTLIKERSEGEGLRILENLIEEMRKDFRDQMGYLKNYLGVYRDSLEIIMDRHKEEPVMYYLKRRHVPLLKKLSELGMYHKALETYKQIEQKLDNVVLPEERKGRVENDLTEIRFEIYKKKDEGKDISEPLTLFTLAQKRFGEGKVVPAEYLVEVSKRYCEAFFS